MTRGNGHNQGQAMLESETTAEIVDYRGNATALESVTRAEIDVQINTAKRFPRSPQRFLQEARSIVALSPEMAAQCVYTLPARRGESSKGPITGPSVRLAEICASTWQNLRIVGRITDDDGKFVTAQGVAMDLERNVGYSVEVRRRVTTKDGRRFGDDMISVTCNAAIAIATRNATFKVIPRAFVQVVEDEARAIARGDVKTLPERRDRALAYFASKGVKEPAVYAALGIAGPADITLDHLVLLQGYRTAVQDGQATVEEIFAARPEGVPQGAAPGESRASGLARRIAEEASPPQPSALYQEADEPAKAREPGEEG